MTRLASRLTHAGVPARFVGHEGGAEVPPVVLRYTEALVSGKVLEQGSANCGKGLLLTGPAGAEIAAVCLAQVLRLASWVRSDSPAVRWVLLDQLHEDMRSRDREDTTRVSSVKEATVLAVEVVQVDEWMLRTATRVLAQRFNGGLPTFVICRDKRLLDGSEGFTALVKEALVEASCG